MLGRVNQHDAVLVEKPLVALHKDLQVALVLERQPCAAVGQHIGIARGGCIEGCAHALANRFVPGTFVLLDVDSGILVPERKLGDVRARAVAARNKGRLLFLDRLQRFCNVFHPFDVGGIALRTDQNEVVVHDRMSLHALAFGEKFFLRRLGVHEHHIGVAAPAGVERLASALRHDFHVDAGLLLEQRQDVAE
jgi:hypothetical protein